jgi:hypothetical protein
MSNIPARTWAALAVLGVIIMTGALMLGASLAHADPDPGSSIYGGTKGDHDDAAFWIITSTLGLDGSIASSGHLGRDVCEKMSTPPVIPEADAIAYMAQALGGNQGTAVGRATVIMHAAEWHYCPELLTH